MRQRTRDVSHVSKRERAKTRGATKRGRGKGYQDTLRSCSIGRATQVAQGGAGGVGLVRHRPSLSRRAPPVGAGQPAIGNLPSSRHVHDVQRLGVHGADDEWAGPKVGFVCIHSRVGSGRKERIRSVPRLPFVCSSSTRLSNPSPPRTRLHG